MQVVRYSSLDQLAPWAADWDRLSREVPFRGWAWMTSWWLNYGVRGSGTPKELFVLGVFDGDGRLAGLAPWYVQKSSSQGRVVRFLGSGEVCSDYLSLLCEPAREEPVAEALAEWLTQATSGSHADRWDLLSWTGVDAGDRPIRLLADRLREHRHAVHCRPGPNCWRIELPASWDDYLATLSKDHRKQLRRTERDYLAGGRAALRTVERKSDLEKAIEILVDLHERRRSELNESGRFRCERFAAFHREVMPRLLEAGRLHLHWVELDDAPAAAEYQLVGGGVVYAYQAGIEPDLRQHSPGRLAHMLTIRRAIESGLHGFDFLRGDEPYKAHWRAHARGSVEIRVVPAHFSARLRHGVWLAGSGVKRWLKDGLRMVKGS
jgi:CelD/BcsL family acetyltransferase involved in cellulose biosynthesis